MTTLKLLMLISAVTNISALQAPLVMLDTQCPFCQQREESTLTTLQDLEKSIRDLYKLQSLQSAA